MEYIHRSIESRIVNYFRAEEPRLIVVTGIVGCGKTTMIKYLIKEEFSKSHQCFEFSGDSVKFRNAVSRDSTYLYEEISSKVQNKGLVFIDEVQKSEAIFDAVKYAFDRGISLIISGSNPHFLKNTAKYRLQRRGRFLNLSPLSLPEILEHKNLISPKAGSALLESITTKSIEPLLKTSISLTEEIESIIENYLIYGGLPKSYLAKEEEEKIEHIASVIERGFEPIKYDTEDVSDIIFVELADLHSKEFTYKTLFKRTGIRSRDSINAVIDNLINHGYLIGKKPYLFEKDRRSYLISYSYIDPGIISYLSGSSDISNNTGRRVEGLCHSRLSSILELIPYKTYINYFKPYSIDSSGKTRFRDGEIDFILSQAQSSIPIEVKSGHNLARYEFETLKEFMAKKDSDFGIVLYKGVPRWDKENSIFFWPYWLV